MKDAVRILKIINGALETLLAIPILGASIIIGLLWIPLLVMLILHIITLVFSAQSGMKISSPVLGIVASVLGVIPFVGWILHTIAAIFNLIEGCCNE